jgi:hypothetical protein
MPIPGFERVMPIPGFESLRVSWLKIEAVDVDLYGLLVYHASDHPFPEYVSDEGLLDLHSWSDRRCLLFVIHSPSQEWIDYARDNDSLWAKLFDQQSAEFRQLAAEMPDLPDKPFLEIDDERWTPRQHLAPSLNRFFLADEIRNALDYFGCKPEEHPCLVLFTDLAKTRYWFVDLRQWRGLKVPHLQIAFRTYLEGPAFSKLLKEASNV